MGSLLTQIGQAEAERTAKALESTTPAQDKAAMNVMYGILRAAGQGATFGFGDEAEAYLRSQFSDRGYEEIRDEVRGKIDQFRDEETAIAYGTEIASSILTPAGAAGLAAKAFPKIASVVGGVLGGKYTKAGLGGALYGAGAAEEIEDVPLSAITGGAIGLGATALVPAATESAKKAIQKGLSLSAGEKYGGVIGALESIANRFGVQTTRDLTEESLSTALYRQIFADLGGKMSKGTSASKAFKLTNDAFKKLYNETLEDVSVAIDDRFMSDVNTILSLNSGMKPAKAKEIQKLAQLLVDSAEDGLVSGQTLKKIQKDINYKLDKLTDKTTNEGVFYEAALKDLDEAMMEAFARADSDKSEALKLLNKAYAKFIPLKRASVKAGTGKDFAFSADQIDAELKRQSRRKAGGETSYLEKKMFGQEEIGLLSDVQPNVVGGVPNLSLLGAASLAPQMADVAGTSLLGTGGLVAGGLGAGAVGLGATKTGRAIMSPSIPEAVPIVGGTPFGGLIDVPSAAIRTPAMTGGILGQEERAQQIVEDMPERAVGFGQRITGMLGF